MISQEITKMVEENKIEFTEEELKDLNSDVAKAKEAIVGKEEEKKASNDMEKLKEELMAQIKADMAKEAEEKSKANEKSDLENQLAAQKKAAEEQLNALTDKINKMQESKAVVKIKSPFTGDEKDFESLINDKEKMMAVDKASMEEFLKQRG